MSDITLIVPNRTHAFPIDIKGAVVNNDNSGTDIFVFIGSEKATPVEEITGPSQFKISLENTNMSLPSLVKDDANKKFLIPSIDGSSIGFGEDLVVVSEIDSSNSADFKNIPIVKGQIVITATISDAQGTIHTKTQVCNYAKARSLFSTDTIFVEVGTTLNASYESIMDPEGIKQITSFNWYSGADIISGATDQSFVVTNDQVGREISAIFKYVDGKNNNKEVVAIQNIFVVNSAPINFPVIKGIPEAGQTLEADTSFIFDRNGIEGDFTYVWLVNDVANGVVAKTLDVPELESEVGNSYKVRVTYTDGAGVENELDSPPVVIRDSGAGDTASIVGTARIGQDLIVSLTTADQTTPTILDYEWRRNGIIIEGENSSVYKVKRADMKKFITATVKYDPGNGTTKYRTSQNVNFENSPLTGTATLAKEVSGLIIADVGNNASVGEYLVVDTDSISDPDDIKDYYYSFDDLVQASFTKDLLETDSTLGRQLVSVKRSSEEQIFSGSSETVSYNQSQEVQSIYLDNSFGNSDDIIKLAYKDENDVWQVATQIEGKSSKLFLLDEIISSTDWKLDFTASSPDNTATSYNFQAKWYLESPSTTSTRNFAYQWFRTANGVTENIIGANKKKYLISQEDLNTVIGATVTFVDGADKIENLDTNTISVLNYAPTGRVSIEGLGKTGNTLTAVHNLRDKDNISVDNPDGNVTQIDSYQWYLDEIEIDGATSQTLLITSDMESKTVKVSATFTDDTNAIHTVKSTVGTVINASPTGDVKIYGSPKVGKILTINTTELEDLNQYNNLFYQWFIIENGVESEIENASLQNYTVKTTDIGKSLRANVYYTDLDSFQEVVSTDTVYITDSVTTGEPTIDGLILAGNTVTANVSNIVDENGIAGYAYQWRIDSTNVDGATFQNFTISADENGNYGNLLDVAVTVTDNAGNVKTVYSSQERIALAAGQVGADGGTISSDAVSLTIEAGSLQEDTVIYVYETTTEEDSDLPEGSTLVGTAWAFTPHGTTFDEPVTIEFSVPEGTNLVLRANDEEDNTFEIVENATVSGNTATLSTNTFSVYVGSVFTPAVITGTPEQGNYLTASVSGDVTDVTFQWKRNGDNILNAQNDTYLVQSDDVGTLITVAATFTDVNNVSTTKTSAELEIVNSEPQGQVNIVGSRRVGITLESQIVSITDQNTIASGYSYQWYRNSVAITGATASSYEVVEDDFLKDLFVNVVFIDGAGTVETVASEVVKISKKGQISFIIDTR
jgi:hypothetical protein